MARLDMTWPHDDITQAKRLFTAFFLTQITTPPSWAVPRLACIFFSYAQALFFLFVFSLVTNRLGRLGAYTVVSYFS